MICKNYSTNQQFHCYNYSDGGKKYEKITKSHFLFSRTNFHLKEKKKTKPEHSFHVSDSEDRFRMNRKVIKNRTAAAENKNRAQLRRTNEKEMNSK